MDRNKSSAKSYKNASAMQIIAFGFVVIILVGAILLSLPASARSGESIGFIDALFTSAAATCVTGLTIADTYTQWSVFGQVVILVLIQIGGVGFMAIGTLFSIALNRKISLRERMILSETISLDSVAEVVRLTQRILISVVVIELVGAVILSLRFIPQFGVWKGIYNAVFHSVSAFCNAGIDLMGQIEQHSSLTHFVHDPIVNFTVMALIITGGLGFVVWEDLLGFRSTKRLRLHTKLVLIINSVLTVGGCLLFLIFEYSNPSTLGGFGPFQKIQAALFQSVTARTAGFYTISFIDMTNQSLLVMILLMLIGGSPGSTAGGIKTTTVGMLVIAAYAVVRGASKVNVFGRQISTGQIMRAIAIIILSLIILFAGTVIILAADGLGMKETIFEVISAFSTAGVTFGVTSGLSTASKITVILLMYLGRVGIITAAMAITKRQHTYEEKITYPTEAILF